MIAAAFAGNAAGFEIGRKVGPPLYQRDGRLLKRRHFDSTHDFFARHGAWALVGGRFVAFVRTFITVVAGATGMSRRRFLLWSGVGATLWVASITLAGYFLGASIPALGNNIDLAMLAILVVFAVPLAWEWWHSRHHSDEGSEEPGQPEQEEQPEQPASRCP